MSSSRTTVGTLPLLVACSVALTAGACGGRQSSPTAPVVETVAGTDPAAAAEPSSDAPPAVEPQSDPDPPAAASRPPHPLDRLFADLEAIDRGEPGVIARVLQIGDSHTASDTLTGPLRELFSERFGSAGRGYVYAGRPWDGYRQRHVEYDAGDGWTGTLGVRRQWEAPLGMGGARIDAAEAGAWITREPCSGCGIGDEDRRLRLFYVAAPDAGRFEVRVDGGAPMVVDAAAGSPGLASVDVEVAQPYSELRVDVVAPPISLLGTSTESGASGVIVEGLGMNGGRADQWHRFDDALTRAEVAALDPDLVVFAFGTNEAYGDTYRIADADDQLRVDERLDRYATAFGELLDRYTLDGTGAACLVVLPPDFHDRDAAATGQLTSELGSFRVQLPPASLGLVASVQRRVAAEHGCEVWSAQDAMGGPGAMSVWRGLSPALGSADAVHLTSRGYTALAERLFSDLLAAYVGWLEGLNPTLATGEAVPGVRELLQGSP